MRTRKTDFQNLPENPVSGDPLTGCFNHHPATGMYTGLVSERVDYDD